MWESPNKFFHVGCSGKAAAGSDVIGIDLGTTNSCVATMEGKVRENLQQYTVRQYLLEIGRNLFFYPSMGFCLWICNGFGGSFFLGDFLIKCFADPKSD
jgi:hypothetical protein